MTNLRREFFDEKLARWRRSAHRVYPDGTEMIGRNPVYEFGWLHLLFAPAAPKGIERLIQLVPILPEFQLYDFFRVLNGMNLFESNLFLLGTRTHFRPDNNVVTPWDLDTHHYEEVYNFRGRKALLVGGSHALPNGIHYVENADKTIDAFDRTDWSRPMYTWPTLDELIVSEVDRLASLYDDEGWLIEETRLADFSYRCG
jgi:hypothetical protein